MKQLWPMALLLLGAVCLAEDQPEIVFHVTRVSKSEATDWCTAPTAKCNGIRHTVEGYTQDKGDGLIVEYNLECVEVVAHEPTVHFTSWCPRVHAHSDYVATLSTDTIFFKGTPPAPVSNVILQGYDIKEEKETRKK